MQLEMTEGDAMRHFQREFNTSRASRKYNILFIIWLCISMASGGAVATLYGFWLAVLVILPYFIGLHFLTKKADSAARKYAHSLIKYHQNKSLADALIKLEGLASSKMEDGILTRKLSIVPHGKVAALFDALGKVKFTMKKPNEGQK